jgi:hypothetical protein
MFVLQVNILAIASSDSGVIEILAFYIYEPCM